MPWADNLRCINHPGNQYPLKGAVWTGGPSRREFKFRGRLLFPDIAIGSISGSPVTGILGNKLVTLGDLLLLTFI
jgi:hypothetical protein